MTSTNNPQTPRQKPKLSFWQIWNMSFGFLGIQFGFALQNANVSRIFETLGANIEDIPILWVAAPVTGLIVQPIIGYMSDRTWNKLGRRRPYFLIGAIFASIALFLMPNSPALWVAAGMLWIMDASINISMEPFRAFVGDNLPDEQRTAGFAMQSFFIGIGAVVASMLPYMLANWFGVSNEAPEGIVPDSVKWSFYIGGTIFFLAVLWTVLKSFEYPPEELAAFEGGEEHADEELSDAEKGRTAKQMNKYGWLFLIVGLLLNYWFFSQSMKKDLYILSFGLSITGILFLIATLLRKGNRESGFTTIMSDLLNMPKTMKQLAWVQFFSWFALFSMWIYTTAGVTSDKYDMKYSAREVSYLSSLVDNLNPTEKEELNKLNDIKEDLNKLSDRIAQAGKEYPMEVRIVNYFLDDRILVEKELVEQAIPILENTESSDNAFENAKKELQEINSYYSNPESSTKKILSYETYNWLDQQKEKLFTSLTPEQENKFEMVNKLKFTLKEYNEGANWVGVSFAVYNGVAALIAFLLPLMAKRTNRKTTHAICLIMGAIGLVSIFFIKNPNLLLASMIGIGIAWASILSMPYAILTGSLPANKMGYYMGVFNFFIVIPQILASAVLGFIISSFFENEAINAMLIGGVSFVIAAGLTMLVDDEKG